MSCTNLSPAALKRAKKLQKSGGDRHLIFVRNIIYLHYQHPTTTGFRRYQAL